jgi:hypothetical protein
LDLGVVSLECGSASRSDGLILIAAAAADADCAYYLALPFQRDSASEDHDLAVIRGMNTEELAP